jgi:hypothetical protein
LFEYFPFILYFIESVSFLCVKIAISPPTSSSLIPSSLLNCLYVCFLFVLQ